MWSKKEMKLHKCILTAKLIWSFPSPRSFPHLIECDMIGSTIARMGLWVRRLFLEAGAMAMTADDAEMMLSSFNNCKSSSPGTTSSWSFGTLNGWSDGDDTVEEVIELVASVSDSDSERSLKALMQTCSCQCQPSSIESSSSFSMDIISTGRLLIM